MPSTPTLRSLVNPGVSERTDFPLRLSSTALLVVDIQKELTTINVSSNDYRYTTSFPRMIENTKKLVNTVRASRDGGNGGEVVFTYLEAQTNNSRDASLDYKLSGSLLSNLPNPSSPAQFLDGLAPIQGKDICLPKTSCSVFQSTNLDYILRNLNVEQLVVCGQLTDQCVESAVRDAADLGYFVTVVDDACGAESEEGHQKGLHGMNGFARIVCTEHLLKEISNTSDVGAIVRGEKIITKESSTTETTINDNGTGGRSFNISADRGCQAAILRSLRAAGVKFLRYTSVDAYNTIRCKTVPLSHTMTLLPGRKARNSTSSPCSPMANPVCIAEVCFAGLPTHADALISSSNLSARNVLTLRPDFSSLRVLPYASKTAMIMCTAHNQQSLELSPLCARGLLERVLCEAREGLGIEFCVGVELEFMLFRSDARGGLPQPVDMSTFANSVTLNEQEEFISTLNDQLEQQDIPVELVHAESAAGQLELVLTYSSNVVQLADDVVFARETISACAKQYGMKALFLPKTSTTQAGNGLHLHFSFRDVADNSNDNAFTDPSQPSGVSLRGQSFIEGVLNHFPSLLSFTLPTVNSFRRMGPGCWTGHEVGWSVEDKEVPIRVCVDLNSRMATNVEFKLSDATANIYLELAMILTAGVEGIKNEAKLRPMMGESNNEIRHSLPTTLLESLDSLKQDKLLTSVMGSALSTAYIAVRKAQVDCEKTLEEELLDAFIKA
jgi:glutamine synthetase